ncbi:cytochrome P450 4C1-like isoform X1 [Zophobas morio]|uniref:cytochrome P450 4C1-like isoform X1 n=2 Tax=Zophobas morio TaxID=2755281 RepID=UPI0030833090
MLVWIFTLCVIFIITSTLWKKRWLLYHAWKIPGPFSVPLVGSVVLLSATKDNFFELVCRNLDSYRPVTKAWAGSQLYIVTTRPADVEKILTNCLNKSPFYDNFNDAMKDTLLTSKVSIWKEHRKMINPSFNMKILNSFHDTFVKYSSEMVQFLFDTEGREQTDLQEVIWEKTLDVALATLTSVKRSAIKERRRVIEVTVKFEKILVERFHTLWLLIDFFWKLSNLHKEHKMVCQIGHEHAENLIAEEYKSYESKGRNDDAIQSNRFLPNLTKLSQTKQITREEILEETIFMMMAASETAAITINTILTILGIYSDIQERLYNELALVLPNIENSPIQEEINRLDYLERVIKEVLRLVPTIPFILRYADEDIKCDPYVFPAGSNLAVPLVLLHRDPDVWPNPEKFDPDRFLPDEVGKRHRCSYIPFSLGTRNCIGFKFGMMLVKVMVATILRKFKVRTVGMKSWKDINWDYMVMLKAKNSRLRFEKRKF